MSFSFENGVVWTRPNLSNFLVLPNVNGTVILKNTKVSKY